MTDENIRRGCTFRETLEWQKIGSALTTSGGEPVEA